MNVVGMGPILAVFLATFGAVIDGSGTAWSIGGTPVASVGGGLLGPGNGISGSHNKSVTFTVLRCFTTSLTSSL